jgi:hypothetical protein
VFSPSLYQPGAAQNLLEKISFRNRDVFMSGFSSPAASAKGNRLELSSKERPVDSSPGDHRPRADLVIHNLRNAVSALLLIAGAFENHANSIALQTPSGVWKPRSVR